MISRVSVLFMALWLASPHSVFAEDFRSSIQIKADCSQLEILDAPLPAVAQALSRESGIEIRLLAGLTGEFITDRLNAKNCSSAVITLLEEFSMMKFWGDDGSLVGIQLLSRKQAWAPEANPETGSVSLVSTQADTVEPPLVRMAEALDKQQVQTLIDVGKGELPPSEVMYNPTYTPYLHKAGLRQPEDWEDKKKVKTLRRHALRAWMQQRKTSQSR